MSTDYKAGLITLGLIDEEDSFNDLRFDDAFAFTTLKRLFVYDRPQYHWVEVFVSHMIDDGNLPDAALYLTVKELGRTKLL